MKKNSLVIVIFFLFKLCVCFLKIDHIELVANEKFNKINIVLNNSDTEKTTINFTAELTTIVQRAKIAIRLKNSADTSKSEKLFRCGNELLKTNVDVCKIASIQSTTFAKVLMENLYRTSNFDLKCSLEPRNYPLTNFFVSDTFMVRFPREQKLCLDLMLLGSLKDTGKLEVLWQLTAWLRIKR